MTDDTILKMKVEWKDEYVLKILGKEGIRYEPFPFKPYFLIDFENIDKVKRKNGIKIIKEGKYAKIEVPNPKSIYYMKDELHAEGIKTYEADVPFNRRILMDLNKQIYIPDDYLIYDIETEPGSVFQDPSTTDNRIYSICAMNQKDEEFVFCDDDEKKLLEDFLDLACKYHVIAGWNSLRFDFPYIKNRASKLGIDFDFFNLIDIDLLAMYRFVTSIEKESFTLDFIGKEEGFGGKEDLGMENIKETLPKLFAEDREKLIKYNMRDVELTSKINKKYGLVDILFTVAHDCYVYPDGLIFENKYGRGSVSFMSAVETICSKKANELGIRVETKRDRPRPIFRGGLVLEPTQVGLCKNVCFFDFKSLYPNIIRAWNIGPDTFRESGGDIKGMSGTFISEPKSFIVEAIDELMHLKDETSAKKAKLDKNSPEYKALERRYHSTKVLINSLFGVMGFSGSKLYKMECADNVMLIAREIVGFLRDYCYKNNWEVMGGDTDSIFLRVKDIEEAKEICYLANEAIKEWAKGYNVTDPNYLVLEVDKYFSSIIFVAKKKYAGWVIYEDDQPCSYIYKRGLESVRHDWPKAVKDFQNRLMKILLQGRDFKKEIAKTKEKLLAGEYDKDLVTYKSLKNKVEEYSSKPPHVRAAEIMINEGKEIMPGDKVGFIKTGKRKDDIIPVWENEVPTLNIKARSFIWKKQFEPIIERFNVSVVNKTTLDDFIQI